MNCPTCTDERLAITDRSGIEIDYCPRCRGVWLDRGELDKLIERSAATPVAVTRDQGWRDDSWKHGKPDSYKKHKRKSFLDEIFDF